MPVFERLVTIVGRNLFESKEVPVTTANLRNYYPGERTRNPLDTFLWGVDLDSYLQARLVIADLPLLVARDLYRHRQEQFKIPDRIIAVVASANTIKSGQADEIRNAFSKYDFSATSLPDHKFLQKAHRLVMGCLAVNSFERSTNGALSNKGWLKPKLG